MDALERLANRLTDMDWGWWPFLYLRPPKDQRLSTFHVGKMAVHYGPAIALLILALIWRQARTTITASVVLAVLASSIVAFFVGYRMTFAYFWNRRAERLEAARTRPAPPAWSSGVD